MSRRSVLLMGVLAATWGASYLFIKIGLRDLSAPFLVSSRLALGTLVLLPFALRVHPLRALRGRWPSVVLLALANMAGSFLLITYGEERIASGLTGVLVASSPVFAALIGLRFDRSARLGPLGWGGIGLGMVGVLVLFGADLTADGDLVVGGLMVLLSGVGYAIGAHLMRARMAGVPPVATATATMGVSALVTLPFALASLPDAVSTKPLLSLLVLGAVGTGLAFLLFYTLISEVGAARASVVAYVAPGFSVFYGAVALGEPVTVGAVAGLVLILLGSWLTARDKAPTVAATVAPAPTRSGPSRSSVPAPARAR